MSGPLEFLLGALLIAMGILRFQVKCVRPFLLCHAATSALVSATYALGGANTGAMVSAATVITVGAQFAIGHKIALRWRLALALPAIALAALLSGGGWLALLPFLAFTLARFAETLQRDLPMRLTLMVCTMLWLAYGWAAGLPSIVLLELLGLASNAVGIWRHHWREPAS